MLPHKEGMLIAPLAGSASLRSPDPPGSLSSTPSCRAFSSNPQVRQEKQKQNSAVSQDVQKIFNAIAKT